MRESINIKRKYFVSMLIFLLTFISCKKVVDDQFTIVATTSILADTIKNIVQDKIKVISLMGAGIDPHTYQVTQNDVGKLRKADMIFYNGLHLEGKMVELLHQLSEEQHAYAVGDIFCKTQLITDPMFPSTTDPHIWFDITLWKQVVQYINDRLQEQYPDLVTHFQKNTNDYLIQLDQLHTMNQMMIQEIPFAQRVLITAHDAFSYFGRLYGIEVIGLQGISTAAECGLRDIKHLVDIIVQRKIKAIFLESSVPHKSMEAVFEGCKQRGHHVQIGGTLYSDALGSPTNLEGHYIGMIKKNVHTIVEALK